MLERGEEAGRAEGIPVADGGGGGLSLLGRGLWVWPTCSSSLPHSCPCARAWAGDSDFILGVMGLLGGYAHSADPLTGTSLHQGVADCQGLAT